MTKLRNSLAASLRALPPFRGKAHLGTTLGRLMPAGANEDCITIVPMRDGSLMELDVRSRTERWAYWTGEYDSKIMSKIQSCLQEGWTVFDVGANVGFYSVALGRKLKPLNGVLHAFEPVKSNYDRMIRCIALNNLEPVVKAHNVALGDEEGTIALYMDGDNNASTGDAVMIKGSVGVEDGLKGNAEARITRLDSFVEEQQIAACHFIKIDVEGAEVMFLQGGAAFLSKHRPLIYGEFNYYWLKQFGQSFLDVKQTVDPWDYRYFKQVATACFVEFTQPEANIQDVLLCPSETSDAVLQKLGVRF